MVRQRFARTEPLLEPRHEVLRHEVGRIRIVGLRSREVQRSELFKKRARNPALEVFACLHAVVNVLRHPLPVDPAEVGGQGERLAQGASLHFARHGRAGGPGRSLVDRIHIDAPDVAHQLQGEGVDAQNHLREQLLAELVVAVAARKPPVAVLGDIFQIGRLQRHAPEQVVAQVSGPHAGIVSPGGVLREETAGVSLLRGEQAAQLRNLVVRRHSPRNGLVEPLDGQIIVRTQRIGHELHTALPVARLRDDVVEHVVGDRRRQAVFPRKRRRTERVGRIGRRGGVVGHHAESRGRTAGHHGRQGVGDLTRRRLRGARLGVGGRQRQEQLLLNGGREIEGHEDVGPEDFTAARIDPRGGVEFRIGGSRAPHAVVIEAVVVESRISRKRLYPHDILAADLREGIVPQQKPPLDGGIGRSVESRVDVKHHGTHLPRAVEDRTAAGVIIGFGLLLPVREAFERLGRQPEPLVAEPHPPFGIAQHAERAAGDDRLGLVLPQVEQAEEADRRAVGKLSHHRNAPFSARHAGQHRTVLLVIGLGRHPAAVGVAALGVDRTQAFDVPDEKRRDVDDGRFPVGRAGLHGIRGHDRTDVAPPDGLTHRRAAVDDHHRSELPHAEERVAFPAAELDHVGRHGLLVGQSVAGIARPLDRRGDHQPPAEQRIGEFEVEFVRSQVQGQPAAADSLHPLVLEQFLVGSRLGGGIGLLLLFLVALPVPGSGFHGGRTGRPDGPRRRRQQQDSRQQRKESYFKQFHHGPEDLFFQRFLDVAQQQLVV